jgi:hypothetical protein
MHNEHRKTPPLCASTLSSRSQRRNTTTTGVRGPQRPLEIVVYSEQLGAVVAWITADGLADCHRIVTVLCIRS